jgi:protein arginine kinase activator
MPCEKCGATDAVVHLTQIVNNQMSTHHLCQVCAAEKGLDSGPNLGDMPLLDVIKQIADDPAIDTRWGGGECSFCGLTHADFRETGRLGCPHCYESFAAELPRLLKRVHDGASKHVGKVYLPPDPTASEMEKRLDGLRRRLERAVQSEDFERAAEIRDEIRSMEPA